MQHDLYMADVISDLVREELTPIVSDRHGAKNNPAGSGWVA
jgi:hypothetical protein